MKLCTVFLTYQGIGRLWFVQKIKTWHPKQYADLIPTETPVHGSLLNWISTRMRPDSSTARYLHQDISRKSETFQISVVSSSFTANLSPKKLPQCRNAKGNPSKWRNKGNLQRRIVGETSKAAIVTKHPWRQNIEPQNDKTKSWPLLRNEIDRMGLQYRGECLFWWMRLLFYWRTDSL